MRTVYYTYGLKQNIKYKEVKRKVYLYLKFEINKTYEKKN